MEPELIALARSLPQSLPRLVRRLILMVESHRSRGSTRPVDLAAVADALILVHVTPEPAEAEVDSAMDPRAKRKRQSKAAERKAADTPCDETQTVFGGLFYLLSLVTELDVAEMLWKACLPEGLTLAHVAATILGSDAEGDPASLLFGGVHSLPKLEVAPEQQEGVASELLENLA